MTRFCSSFFIIVLLIISLSSTAHGEIITKTLTSFEGQNGGYVAIPQPTLDDNYKKNKTEVTTIIYTTIVYTSSSQSSPTPTVFNISNTNPGHQEQSSQPTDSNGQSLQESLQDDQQALRRMIMILSLVGGLGIIAVVATIVIFTRMRIKNKRQREMDKQSGDEAISDEGLIHSSSSDDNNNRFVIHSASSLSSLSVDMSDDRQYLEPSAPPAAIHSDINSRRNLISMSSQTTAPSPSAPTAKELDAVVDDVNSQESSSHYHSSSHMNACSRCAPLLDPPELPPPAYTPSAPPHYDLPPETTIISPSSSTPFPSRRHSTGA